MEAVSPEGLPAPSDAAAEGAAELPVSAESSGPQAVAVAASAVTAAAARTRRAERVARRERIMNSSGFRLRCFLLTRRLRAVP